MITVVLIFLGPVLIVISRGIINKRYKEIKSMKLRTLFRSPYLFEFATRILVQKHIDTGEDIAEEMF
jgi:hypothetical protein